MVAGGQGSKAGSCQVCLYMKAPCRALHAGRLNKKQQEGMRERRKEWRGKKKGRARGMKMEGREEGRKEGKVRVSWGSTQQHSGKKGKKAELETLGNKPWLTS